MPTFAFQDRAVRLRLPLLGAVGFAWLLGTAGLAAAQTVAERQIQRHAAVGQTVRIRGHVNYHPCGTVVPTTISVIETPQHGTLGVRDEIVTSTDPDLGRGNKCRGSSGMGRVVYYTRTSAGRDEFKYDSLSGNGVVHLYVTVE